MSEHQAWLAPAMLSSCTVGKEAAALPFLTCAQSRNPRIEWRAIGAARSGNPSAARQIFKKYLDSALREEQFPPTQTKLPKRASATRSRSRILFADNKSTKCEMLRLQRIEKDADDVDSLAMPARRMLADLLLELKRPRKHHGIPGRPKEFAEPLDALYGAGHAAQIAGDSAAANAIFHKAYGISGQSRSALSEPNENLPSHGIENQVKPDSCHISALEFSR